MVAVYAVFMCFQVTGQCTLLADTWMGDIIRTAAACETVRHLYDGDDTSAPAGMRRAYTITCMKQQVPAWEPAR